MTDQPSTREVTAEQAAFRAALDELHAAERKARELSWLLPDLTPEIVAGAVTAWRGTPAQIVELGYSRWTDVENEAHVRDVDDPDDEPTEPPVWHASTNGWDDYSDEGAVEYVEVDGLPYAMPDDMNYD